MGEEQTLCLKAYEQFGQLDFQTADDTLKTLGEMRKSDWRTNLNRAVVSFCASRLTKLDEFLSELNKICDQLQIKLEVCTPSASKQPQDSTTLCLFYNYALSLFLGCQYSMALCVVERLLPFCEPYDDALSLKIAFLAIQLHLTRGSFDRALSLITQMESALPGNQPSEAPTNESDSSGWTRNKLALYKAYALLLAGNMKSSKRELKQLSANLSSKQNQSHTAYIGYMLAWLKCHFEYLRGNGRKTLKLLNAVSGPLASTDFPFAENLAVPGFDHAAAYSIVRACGMFQMRRFNSAASHLLEAWDALDKLCQQTATGNGALSLRTLSFAGSAYSAVGYNIASCFLHAGLYSAAFDAFISTLGGVKHMPQVWLHLAECCIQLHEQVKPNPRSASCRLSVVGNSFGNGLHRKIPINSDFLHQVQPLPISESQQQQQRPTLEFASACLSNCLMLIGQYRALTGPSAKASVSDDQSGNKSYLGVGLPLSVVSNEMLDSVQAHALLSLAYVSLSLSNFNMAVRAGTDLLALGAKLSPVVKYLGHLYMAEALVNVDRIADAVGYLSAGNLAQDFANLSQVGLVSGRASVSSASGTPRERSLETDPGDNSPHSLSSVPQFWPNSQAAAQAILVYNLAVAYATRGDYDRAKVNLDVAMSSIPEPWPAHFYHLAFYLALCDAPTVGASRALEFVRKYYYTHVTPNR